MGSGWTKNGRYGQSTRPKGKAKLDPGKMLKTFFFLFSHDRQSTAGEDLLEIVCALFHHDSVSRVVATTIEILAG